MKYISTRGLAGPKSFIEVATSGLASDGGLYVPEVIPEFSSKELKKMAKLSYQDLAFEIFRKFIDGEIEDKILKGLIKSAYSSFRDEEVVRMVGIEPNHHVLELFHGSTLAFKDIALQFLGKLLEHILEDKDEHVVILGATSGDTGSAAIAGIQGIERIKLFMLHPNNRVSEVQRRQMTTVIDKNIYNLAVGKDHGNFDDCQTMIKQMFQKPDFAGEHKLMAVNSINWVRIMAQITYYFYSAFKIGLNKDIAFSVPTGNFGDIFAGFIAQKMGLPIKRLIVATNQNDILNRFFKANDYSKKTITPSISPSMDIQISSNFERLLYFVHDRNSAMVRDLMTKFNETGKLKVELDILQKISEIFVSQAVSEEETLDTIKQIYEKTGYVADPHTAIGIKAGQTHQENNIVITLATAHPAKFPDAIQNAIGLKPQLPERCSHIMESEEKYDVVENDLKAVEDYIKNKLI